MSPVRAYPGSEHFRKLLTVSMSDADVVNSSLARIETFSKAAQGIVFHFDLAKCNSGYHAFSRKPQIWQGGATAEFAETQIKRPNWY